jgi:hypothetical protein
MGRTWAILFIALSACAYVSKDEFDEAWDKDHDGWPLGEDCADDPTDLSSKVVFPFAPDVRGDGCDADCGKAADADGDDWPDDADCAPDDPTIYPCSPDEVDGDTVDNDCDGHDGVRADTCPGFDPDYDPDPTVQTRFTQDNCPFPAPAFAD